MFRRYRSQPIERVINLIGAGMGELFHGWALNGAPASSKLVKRSGAALLRSERASLEWAVNCDTLSCSTAIE